MHRAVVRVAVVVGLTALLSACTSNDAPQAASTVAPTTVPPTTTTPTTLIPSTTTTRPETTTTIEGQVGSREKLLDRMGPAISLSKAVFGIEAAEIPIPEIQVASPVVAAEELIAFEFWVYENALVEAWADVLAIEGSPDWTELRGSFGTWTGLRPNFLALRAEPLELIEVRLATPEEIAAIPDRVVEAAGPKAVAITSRTTIAPHQLVGVDDPDFVIERSGWEERTQVTLLVPGEIGWQYFWTGAQE